MTEVCGYTLWKLNIFQATIGALPEKKCYLYFGYVAYDVIAH